MKNFLLTFLTVLTFGANAILAQALTLNDCVSLALENKETLQSAQLDLESAKLGKIGALSNILPSVKFSGGVNETSYAQSDLYPNQSIWSGGISGTQNIYDGGGWWNRIAQAKNYHLISQQLERQVKTNVIAEVHRAYFQLLKNQQLMEVAQQNFELTDQQVALAQKRFDLGAAKKTDLLKSEVARGKAKSALITQEALVSSAISELRNAMGTLNNNNKLFISEELAPLEQVPGFVEAIEILDDNNPGVLAAQAQLTDSKLRFKLTRALRLPSLSASASYGATSSDLDGLPNAMKDDWSLSSGLNLSFPIFNGMSLSTQTQQAKLAVRKQENDAILIRDNAVVRLESLWGIVSDYFKIIPINEEVLTSAEEDLKLVSERYRLGSASILELLDAQISVTRARVDLVSSKYNARIQEAYLKAQLGILDKEL